ncbi:MAG: hypothetical protein AAF542_07465 [Pseudomonadota bacterium]
MKRVWPVRPSYFIWTLVPMALWLAYTTYGLPHMKWSYSWRDTGQGYDISATRYYTRCTYIGPYGEFTIIPLDGRCDFVLFRKKETG